VVELFASAVHMAAANEEMLKTSTLPTYTPRLCLVPTSSPSVLP